MQFYLHTVRVAHFNVRVCAKSFQSCPTLYNPMDPSPGGLPCPPPGDLPNPGIKPRSLTSPVLAGEFFATSVTWEAHLSIQQYLNCGVNLPSI